MTDNLLVTNKVYIEGKVISEVEFSHQMYGEGFYILKIEVPRLSEAVDILPVTVSERLISIMDIKVGSSVGIVGQLRSYNKIVDGNNRLILTIFARDINPISEISKTPNQIFIDGFICKSPVYRTTPFGREITDILVAANRPYNKSDYIPVIAWGRNARFSSTLEIGSHIRIWGRIQSREYEKKVSEDVTLSRVAYEVSITKMESVSDEEEADNNESNVYELNASSTSYCEECRFGDGSEEYDPNVALEEVSAEVTK
ncbi:single-stranded DNA-binding protein [Clostridium cylindrosporum]|uniref:Single-stranded DNA binding protein n=1 Tax=Clostridium cylindrosporum DSM 605 TaxID=1121307 RepID=A0A0J8G4S7_CLOCY|nr:single-stranded DNA-binding protein [Clostridium cylindrosporum]KMT22681.1 single-stranded DNA binding protein [Clostridium cylindrosporum DSM 605]